jgi:uncharacterized protein (TIGR03118 family)
MTRTSSWLRRSAIAALGLAATAVACSDSEITGAISSLNSYKQTSLVADASGGGAAIVDANLVNPWGIAFGATGTLWVANNGTGTSTLYDANGNKQSTTVSIPGGDLLSAGAPTGLVFNSTSDFIIPGSGAALFIFAGEDGTISAWNTSTGSNATLVASRAANDAVYKGVAIGTTGGANFLYLTDFKNAHVDVFDRNFAFVKSFTDSTVPSGYAPFGISNVGNGQLFVTFAKQKGPDDEDDDPGVGNGFVDVFNANGTMARRFASNGTLNSPWGVVVAPASFGAFGGDILVGNFGDGHIGAYDPTTGSFIDVLRDATTTPIAIDGLWGLTLGPAASTLYFSAGPSDESHGLVGTLTVP